MRRTFDIFSFHLLMPLGVPKVPYRMPGDSVPQWVDLYNRLYRQRLLFMGQELDDELANQLVGIMLYLNAEDPTIPVFMYINSPGGAVTSGFGVYDVVTVIMRDVTTMCVGVAASMASLVLTGGTLGQRLALPNARMMIHQPEGGSMGQASEVFYESNEVERLRDTIVNLYVERTRQSRETIILDLNRDLFMSPRQARSYGLIDAVALPTVKEEYTGNGLF
jgi:ATP-dependent Clp protease, protease subunit